MSEVKERPAHQQRVLAERLDLAYKVDRLTAFFPSQVFVDLPDEDRRLLELQYGHMHDYLRVLDQRIARFDKEPQ